MPIYEYKCEKCAQEFEIIQKFSDKPKVKCEACGGRLKKLLSAAAFHLKGSGWYATDYAGKSGTSGKKEAPAKAAETTCPASGTPCGGAPSCPATSAT